jgi:Fe-Mn family superoxide dismutase
MPPLEKAPELQSKSTRTSAGNINKRFLKPFARAVRNNGGGHWNHSMFWTWMAPNAGGAPTGKAADAIQRRVQ